jgi:adenylylsulfate kinase-like enzyme
VEIFSTLETDKKPIIWLTGQPGAGKTSICKHALKLDEFHIDGDDLRELFDNKDYTEFGRRRNVELAQQIAEFLHNKGKKVWVSLVSPYKDQRDKFKEKMGKDYMEVYVHTSEIRGRESFFVGDYGKPDENYVDVDTTNTTLNESVDKIFQHKRK